MTSQPCRPGSVSVHISTRVRPGRSRETARRRGKAAWGRVGAIDATYNGCMGVETTVFDDLHVEQGVVAVISSCGAYEETIMNKRSKLLSMVRTDVCRDRASLRRPSAVPVNMPRIAAVSLAGGVLALGLTLNGIPVTWANGAHESPMAAMHGERADDKEFRFGQPGKPEDVKRTIQIAAEDIKFDKGTIQVRSGETVRFVVTNTGKLRHEFVLGDTAEQREHEKEMQSMAGMSMTMMHDDPNGIGLAPGETKELIWKFGSKGSIQFACHEAGHFPAGMVGTIKIE